jgi:hypothetical protein
MTARLLPFTVDGLIWVASMVLLEASRRNQRVPRLAQWSLGVGIVATVCANLAHGLSHGPIGALVSARPERSTPAQACDLDGRYGHKHDLQPGKREREPSLHD